MATKRRVRRKPFSLATKLRNKIISFIEGCMQLLMILGVAGVLVGPAPIKIMSGMLLGYVAVNLTLNLKPRRAR